MAKPKRLILLHPVSHTKMAPDRRTKGRSRAISACRGVGSERRVHPCRLHQAEGRRRLRSGRHAGAQGHGQRRTRPAGIQRRRPPQERSERARTVTRVRVLAEHRQSRRRPYRQGRQRRTHRRGIELGGRVPGHLPSPRGATRAPLARHDLVGRLCHAAINLLGLRWRASPGA